MNRALMKIKGDFRDRHCFAGKSPCWEKPLRAEWSYHGARFMALRAIMSIWRRILQENGTTWRRRLLQVQLSLRSKSIMGVSLRHIRIIITAFERDWAWAMGNIKNLRCRAVPSTAEASISVTNDGRTCAGTSMKQRIIHVYTIWSVCNSS